MNKRKIVRRTERAESKYNSMLEETVNHQGVRSAEPEDAPLGHRSLEIRDDTIMYIAYAKDSTNTEQTKQIGEWLRSIVTDKQRYIAEAHDFDGNVSCWGQLTLDDDGLEQVKNHEGVKGVNEDYRLEEDLGSKAMESTLRSVQIKRRMI